MWDRLAHYLADHLPLRVVYWTVIRCVSFIRDDEEVPSVPYVTVAKRIGKELSS